MPYKVRTPSGVWADGEWDTREEIPERVADRFEHYFEPAEYVVAFCSVCRTTEKVHELDLGAASLLNLPFCEDCFNSGKSREWLAAEFEAALMEDPRMHKNSDGTWSERKSELRSALEPAERAGCCLCEVDLTGKVRLYVCRSCFDKHRPEWHVRTVSDGADFANSDHSGVSSDGVSVDTQPVAVSREYGAEAPAPDLLPEQPNYRISNEALDCLIAYWLKRANEDGLGPWYYMDAVEAMLDLRAARQLLAKGGSR